MKLPRILSILTLLPLAAASAQQSPATPADAQRYVVLFSERPAGYMKAWTAGGERRYEFEFNDRGRGPHLTERVRLDAKGLPAFVETFGHGYFKDSVEERFRYESGVASWKNRVEGDARAPGEPRFYVSVSGVPAEGELLARALLAAPGGRLALLPTGEASIEKVGELTITVRGKRRPVDQYAISGLGFSPSYIWLDRDGGGFASVSSWFSLAPEGWEGAVPAMVKAQEAAQSAWYERLARQLARRPRGALVFRDANLFDAESATLRPRTTVVVSGDRIQAVGPDGSVPIPAGAEMIDARGKTLLPGLWDMHVHISPGDDGLLHLAAGVTMVRDMGNDTVSSLALRRKFDRGTLIGPRVIMAGLIDSPGPYQVPTGVLASTEREARAAVDRYAELGYEQIKVYSSTKPELVPSIVDRAHKRGLRVSGHVPAFMTAEQVVKLGFDEVQHANMLMLNFMDSVRDTRSMARFTAVAQHGAEIELGSERVRRFIQLLKERHTVIDPTLVAFEAMFTGRPGQLPASAAPIADRVPAQVRRGFFSGGLPVPEGMDQRYRESHRAMLRMVRAMHDAGVRIVAGTDDLAGFMLHRELELYVEAGIPAPEVLRIATLGAARAMKHDGDRGSIASGKLADLVLVDGDPTTRISDIRKVETVVKGGTLYRSAELYRAMGIRP